MKRKRSDVKQPYGAATTTAVVVSGIKAGFLVDEFTGSQRGVLLQLPVGWFLQIYG